MRMRFNTVLCVAVAVLLNLEGSFCQLDVCGQAPLNTEVTETLTANEGYWPWQVNIFSISYATHRNSGTLINQDWVLTSVSGIENVGKSDMLISLGRESYQSPNPHEVNRTVLQIIRHPNDNLALIQLSSPVTFTDYIRPVCLAAAGSVFDEGLSSWGTGWGQSSGGFYSFTDDLWQTEMPVVSKLKCDTYFPDQPTTTNMMCAGKLHPIVADSKCLGDFGGPLVIKQGSQWIQSGITISYDAPCYGSSFPAVFVRVSQYQEWINTQIYTYSDSAQPGFVLFPQPAPPTTPYITDSTPNISKSTPYIPDSVPYPIVPTSDIDDHDDCIHDIFSGSSLSLHSYPISLTFSIISLIFCFFFKVV